MTNKHQGWQPIADALDHERVIVAGWVKPYLNVAGYWWWYEDTVYDGEAAEHPEATIWTSVVLPPFPLPPEQEGGL